MRTKTFARLGTTALSALAVAAISGTAQGALLCTAGSGSSAGTFTCSETITFGPARTDFTNAVLTIDKWTSGASAGFTETLTSVAFSLGGRVVSIGSLTNQSASAQTFTFGESESFSFAAGIGAPPGFVTSVATGSAAITVTNLAPGATAPLAVTTFLAPSLFTTTNLTGFTGPGTFQVLASSLTGETISGGGGNISQLLSTSATPLVDITYTFQTATVSAVPEPGEWALMGLGLSMLGMFVRRRQRT